ncbi:hypothetical protein AB1Y20_009301 [Prymnesium parvum]|uniref:Dynamin GTPase n=1 Tax=Prymnesium parvum TaxID=97485 RepID=A0AB34K0B5_PRYPA
MASPRSIDFSPRCSRSERSTDFAADDCSPYPRSALVVARHGLEEGTERLRSLVELNDQVNQLTLDEREINSTRIVVLGDQSHGKSSLLEAISGVDLPRGDDIRTRAPLVLQLRKAAEDSDEYALICVAGSGELPQKVALEHVAAKVEEYTARLAGCEKAVTDTEIELKVFRHGQEDLTLIDLPGITRVAQAGQGDGPEAGRRLEQLILGMCRRYAEPPESILLNVVSAMVDFSTSAALQLSQELDPTCQRTLLCVTKVDQYREKGLHTKLQCAARAMRIRREHIFAVRNRTKEENEQNLPLAEVRALEREAFFENTELILGSKSAGYGLGVDSLSKKLVEFQLERLTLTLPTTAHRIADRLGELHERIAELGAPQPDAMGSKIEALQLIDRCVHRLHDERTGQLTHASAARLDESAVGEIVDLTFRPKASFAQLRHSLPPHADVESLEHTLRGGVRVRVVVVPRCADGDEPPPPLGVWVQFALPKGVRSLVVRGGVHLLDAADEVLWTGNVSHAAADERVGWATVGADVAARCVAVGVNLYVARVTYTAEAAGEDARRMLCTVLNDLDKQFLAALRAHRPERSFFSQAFYFKVADEAHSRRGSSALPGSISHEVLLAVLRDLRKGVPELVERHVAAVAAAMHARLRGVIGEIVDARAHPRLLALLQHTAAALVQQSLAAAQQAARMLLQLEADETHTANALFPEIVRSLRKELLGVDERRRGGGGGGEACARRWDVDVAPLRRAAQLEPELLDIQIKAFAYWKSAEARLVDYVQMCARSHLSTALVDRKLKPALVEALETACAAGGMAELMAADEALALERQSTARRIDCLHAAEALLREAAARHGLQLQPRHAAAEGRRAARVADAEGEPPADAAAACAWLAAPTGAEYDAELRAPSAVGARVEAVLEMIGGAPLARWACGKGGGAHERRPAVVGIALAIASLAWIASDSVVPMVRRARVR